MKRESVKITDEHLRELELLKLAWRKKSIDAVLEELILHHRHEKIKAIDIKVVEETS